MPCKTPEYQAGCSDCSMLPSTLKNKKLHPALYQTSATASAPIPKREAESTARIRADYTLGAYFNVTHTPFPGMWNLAIKACFEP